MTYSKEECIKDTKKHIKQVGNCIDEIVSELLYRSLTHDKSKLQSPEVELFTEYTPKLAACTYGSDEYKENLKGLKVALDHHYEHNSHHPEHFPNGVQGMNLLDLIEMFCDWKAATMRHNDGDLDRSIEINKERFNLSDDLTQIFKNSVSLFDDVRSAD
ncbi:hypothetical protein BH780_gp134 [Bacillus phage Eldridge]|uniref:Uncharacterized protein n=1 Tax=Bacillus phage Eldridge TaxID=1776293 RepID=A0A0Y0AEU3_9CAUD|nr:hypothetical protein BH780_gp134 [Bacillus phage Eldridge]AMB18717.1 hypothetical protein Eldridge_0137 [Bacillus phage Eldridge]